MRIKYYVFGFICGIGLILLINFLRRPALDSPKLKIEAIEYAQELVRKEYENKYDFAYLDDKDREFTNKIDFKAKSQTKIEITEFGTFAITLIGVYQSNRVIKRTKEATGGFIKSFDVFFVELKPLKGKWELIDFRLLSEDKEYKY